MRPDACEVSCVGRLCVAAEVEWRFGRRAQASGAAWCAPELTRATSAPVCCFMMVAKYIVSVHGPRREPFDFGKPQTTEPSGMGTRSFGSSASVAHSSLRSGNIASSAAAAMWALGA
eukprot:6177751-Pleurochrysis_carterae.AAC.4